MNHDCPTCRKFSRPRTDGPPVWPLALLWFSWVVLVVQGVLWFAGAPTGARYLIGPVIGLIGMAGLLRGWRR